MSLISTVLTPTLICLAIVGCNGSSDGDTPEFPAVVSLGDGDLFPSILNSSLAIGPNRVVMQLIDDDDEPVFDAEVTVRYYDLNGNEPVFVSEAIARRISTELSFIDENAGFERTITGDGGVYVTPVTFAAAGAYGAEITAINGETKAVVPYRFTVREQSLEPGIGDPAPPSVQATTASAPINEIDSSFPVRKAMHTTTVADALKTGKPLVIAFATPAFCTSRTCGPILDLVVDPLFQRYGNEAIFIHIEPYRLQDAREANLRNPVPAALEWRLQSEPWMFVVGTDGRIAAKFEGIVAESEVEAVLKPLVQR